MQEGGWRVKMGDVRMEAEVGVTPLLTLKMEEGVTSQGTQALPEAGKGQARNAALEPQRGPVLMTP